jgi:DNA-binding NtrC family response regulator
MREGRFREDLYFRLHVILIRLPPLRERRGDIARITDHYLRRFCAEYAVPVKRITPAAARKLEAYAWPGNVRELRNVLEKMVVLIEPEEIRIDHLAAILPVPERVEVSGFNGGLQWKEAKVKFERDFLIDALDAAGWNVSVAARRLGIPRTYLYKKMKRHGLGRLEG